MGLSKRSSNTRRAMRRNDSGPLHSIDSLPPAPPRSERGPLPLARAQVRIYAADGERIVGSGFLAGERAVLTCAHVVTLALGLPDDTPEPPPGQVSLDFPLLAPDQRLTARVAHWRLQDDIAVLELESAPPAGAEPAPLAEGGDLWGHPFRAFGFPVGHPEGVWASGVVRGPTACGGLQIEDTKETGYRVQPGFSGAPVWDDALGGVVGMVSAAERDPSVRAAFIIPPPMSFIIPPPVLKMTITVVELTRRIDSLEDAKIESCQDLIEGLGNYFHCVRPSMVNDHLIIQTEALLNRLCRDFDEWSYRPPLEGKH